MCTAYYFDVDILDRGHCQLLGDTVLRMCLPACQTLRQSFGLFRHASVNVFFANRRVSQCGQTSVCGLYLVDLAGECNVDGAFATAVWSAPSRQWAVFVAGLLDTPVQCVELGRASCW